MPDTAAQVPLLRLDIAQLLGKLHGLHDPCRWTGDDIATAADLIARLVEERYVAR